MAEKRFYWLKLKDDFFNEKYIKLLRRMAGGDTYVIIYLKMQLASLKTDGLIKHEMMLPSYEDELALLLDEDPILVKQTLAVLKQLNIVELWQDNTLYMSALQSLIGTEGSSAERVRRLREKQKLLEIPLQCNEEALPSNNNVTESNADVTKCNIEKEKELERKRKEKENKERVQKDIVEILNYMNLICKKNFKPTTKTTIQHIETRIKEGYTVDEFKKVIDIKSIEWLNDAEMNVYLRPETLFGNKFESYLNSKPIDKSKATEFKPKVNKFTDIPMRETDFEALEAAEDKYIDEILAQQKSR